MNLYKGEIMWLRYLIPLIVICLVVPYGFAEEQVTAEKTGTYAGGKIDGEVIGGEGSMMLGGGAAGCLLGPIGYLFIPMAGSEPPYYMMKDIEDKNDDYKLGFREGYKGKKKSQFIQGVTVGWLAWLAIVVLAVSSGGD